MSYEHTPNPQDPDDISDLLAAEGIDLSAAMTIRDDNEGIPTINGRDVYDALKNAPLPDLTPLKFDAETNAKLAQPVETPEDAYHKRRLVYQLLLDKVTENDALPEEQQLRIDEDVAFDAQQAVSEILQNALRYGGGAYCILLGRTALNNLFIGVPNKEAEKEIGADVTPISLSKEEDEDTLPHNEHYRGLHVVGSLSVNHLLADRQVSAGLTLLDVQQIGELMADYDATREEASAVVDRRPVVWGVFGQDMVPNEDALPQDSTNRSVA